MAISINTSYFFGVDELYGWGNRSYFTFFSEFNRPWKGIGIIEAIIFNAIFIVSLVANFIIIVRVVRVHQLKTVTNCFIANLAMADLLFTTGCPVIAVVRITGTWVLGAFFCHTLVYLEFVCMFAVIWTMTVISIDRFICIVKPNNCRISLKMAIAIVIVIWLFAFTSSIPMAAFFNVKSFSMDNSTIKICTLVWPQNTRVHVSVIFVSCLFVIGFVMPLSILSHNYYRVFRTFWKSRKTINRKESRASQNVEDLIKCTSSGAKRRSARNYRVIRILVLLVLLFFLMWLPIFIAFIGVQYDGSYEYFKMHSWMLMTCAYFAFGNACVNPFVYVFINERFRLNILSCRKTRKGQPKSEELGSFTGSASWQYRIGQQEVEKKLPGLKILSVKLKKIYEIKDSTNLWDCQRIIQSIICAIVWTFFWKTNMWTLNWKKKVGMKWNSNLRNCEKEKKIEWTILWKGFLIINE